ncbi:hypothetical protein Hypma_004451 [Hypsizygus marmoreus]|uniref:Uncharacterized protein n=1 Tax=Hypsizygus marmoreus TaxID=39966 RepID=A0A369K131_HYPMA|nr:hypothetical protein Hypma_004451 [Hypsizygus marmoreus]
MQPTSRSNSSLNQTASKLLPSPRILPPFKSEDTLRLFSDPKPAKLELSSSVELDEKKKAGKEAWDRWGQQRSPVTTEIRTRSL